MHILYIAHFAGSPEHGMVHAYYHLAQEWLKLGNQVTIVAASFSHTRNVQPVAEDNITAQCIDGINYLWVKTSAYQAQNNFGRVKNIIQFVLKAWLKKLPIESADLVICSSHHPFAILPAQHLAKVFDARLVFEVRDLWPLTLIELGRASPKNPFIWLMQKAEDYAYRHTERVISVLSGAKEYMEEHGLDAKKYSYVPNGYAVSNQSEADLPSCISALLHELKKSDKFIVGYAGSINNGNALTPLIESLVKIEYKPVALLFLGDGPKVNQLLEIVERLKVTDKVFFLGSVNKSVVQLFLQQVDAAYVGFQKRDLYRYGVSPTKLNDYMYAGKPIIYAIDAPDDPVMESGCGVSCRAENVEDIANAIDSLADMTEVEREVMGQRGYNWLIENRDYRKLAMLFLEEVMA